jgi:hypothetical protein
MSSQSSQAGPRPGNSYIIVREVARIKKIEGHRSLHRFENRQQRSKQLAIASQCPPIRSYVAIKLPMKVVIKRLRTAQISSGTSQIVAPIFLAMLMANLAFM